MMRTYRLNLTKAALAMCFMLSLPTQLLAKKFKIYFRDTSDDAQLSLYLWYGMGDGTVKPAGDWDAAKAYDFPTETIGGKTWKYFEFDTESNYGNTTTTNDGKVNAIIQKQNSDGDIQTVDINNISDDTYLLTEGYFKIKNSDKKFMLFHDVTRSEAEGNKVSYEIKASCGNTVKTFAMTNVRNQEKQIHSINTSLFTVGIWDKDLPGSTGDKVKFYIAGLVNGDESDICEEYRPHESNDGFNFTETKDVDGTTNRTYVSYDNCPKEVSSRTFQVTKGSGVSYTICLNNSSITDVNYHANPNTTNWNPNKPVGYDYHTTYGTRSVAVYTNKGITADAEGYWVIGNFLKVSDPNSDNQGLEEDNQWSPANSDRRHEMKKIDTFDATIGDPDDIVYECKLNKPATPFASQFFNICPKSLMDRTDMTWGASVNKQYSTDKWNYIIRPQVQAGKDAIALHGCVEITPTLVEKTKDKDGNEVEDCKVMNRAQSFNASPDDNYYSQFTVYLNLTKSSYTIVPEESIDLIGNAVGIINRGSGEWQSGQWENGERQYHYVRMARNKDLDYKTGENTDQEQTTKCWEYTGMFYQYDVEGGRGGANAQNGFRFLTNQTYVRNYIEDSHRPEHFTTAQKNASDYKDKLAVNNPYWNEVMLDPYNGVSSMKSPIYPYNPNGRPIYGGLGNERDEGLHIGFVLPTGIYTMRFWQTKDKDGKIVKTWYTLGERVTPPSPLPDNTDVYDNLNCIRTFSSANAYKKPAKMRVFIVDSYSNGQAHLKEIDYIPANTGVILAYNKEDANDIKKATDNLEFVGENDQDDQKYIFEKFPSINFEETAENTEIGTNYLMPSVASQTVETTEYADEDSKTIAYRNYMFTAYKKKGDSKYTLCFKRVITGKTSANSAYLRLPADLCGGTKVTANDEKIIGSSAQFPDYNPQSAKECFASVLWGDSETTGISETPISMNPKGTATSNAYYTLQGVKVSKPSSAGIYIKNGKKVVVR